MGCKGRKPVLPQRGDLVHLADQVPVYRRSTALDANTITIKPPMWLNLKIDEPSLDALQNVETYLLYHQSLQIKWLEQVLFITWYYIEQQRR